jgi:16S rRNA (adenine1518-N6/adenine1519-N6)-dimethyltransferase
LINTKKIKAKKSLGQNFLVDGTVTRRIVESISANQSDIIFEIGPGKGALTERLLASSGLVVAIELDGRLIERLRNQFQNPKFALIEADALAIDWDALLTSSIAQWKDLYPQTEKHPRVRVVANLPYYISTPIVEKLLRLRGQLSDLTLMLQEEVVDRITSKPGSKEYGYLSLLVQYYALAEKLFTVAPSAFSPMPKVYSAVVRLVIRESPAVAVGDEERFFALLRAAFAQRRKTILNNLKAASSILKNVLPLDEALVTAKIDSKRRAETISLEEFARLYQALFAL